MINTSEPRRRRLALWASALGLAIGLGALSPAIAADYTTPAPMKNTKMKTVNMSPSKLKTINRLEKSGLTDVKRGLLHKAQLRLDQIKKRCGDDCPQYSRLSTAIEHAESKGG
jgi:hypothetical protein